MDIRYFIGAVAGLVLFFSTLSEERTTFFTLEKTMLGALVGVAIGVLVVIAIKVGFALK